MTNRVAETVKYVFPILAQLICQRAVVQFNIASDLLGSIFLLITFLRIVRQSQFKMHATNKSAEDEFYRWLGGVIWITVVDRIFDEGILGNSMAAYLLAVSLESCSKANVSADVTEEEITIYILFFP